MVNNYNKMVGTLSEERTKWNEKIHEYCIMTRLKCCDGEISVVMPKKLHAMYKGHRVQLTGFLKQNNEKEFCSYFYCVWAEDVDDEPDDKRFMIEGLVVGTSSLKLTGDEVTQFKFTVRCTVKVHGKFIHIYVPCRAHGDVAKSMIDVDSGDILYCDGYLTQARDKAYMQVQKYERR